MKQSLLIRARSIAAHWVSNGRPLTQTLSYTCHDSPLLRIAGKSPEFGASAAPGNARGQLGCQHGEPVHRDRPLPPVTRRRCANVPACGGVRPTIVDDDPRPACCATSTLARPGAQERTTTSSIPRRPTGASQSPNFFCSRLGVELRASIPGVNPPGHNPGLHLPGSLIPIGAAVAAIRAAAERAEAPTDLERAVEAERVRLAQYEEKLALGRARLRRGRLLVLLA